VLLRLVPERRFIVLALAALLLLVLLGLVTRAADGSRLSIMSGASLALAVGVLIMRPRSREIKQAFTPTPRARRLLITALIAVVMPILIGVWLGAGAGWQIALTLALFGCLTLLLTPLYLPLANLLMWPVEATVRRYYLRLAGENLRRSGATVIAMTGSYGKTSTKHYLQHILEGRFRALMTPRSYNTLLGISRAINDLLSKEAQLDYFLAEAGAYVPGEIARICQLVKPSIGMVISVGPMHLERFGSLDNIVKAKYEIIEALPPDGIGVFNADDERVLGMAQRGYPQQRLLVTQHGVPGARLAASDVRMTAEGTSFTLRDTHTGEQCAMQTPLFGDHNLTNILMAVAVARHVGMSLDEIAPRVGTLRPAEHRLVRTIHPNGVIVIDDAYSANPVGTQVALKVLALQTEQNRVVVTSGMFELGAVAEEENRKLGERMAAVATHIYLIGEQQTLPIKAGVLSAGFPPDRLVVVGSIHEAIAHYQTVLRPGDALLLLTDLPDTYA
jgi:UDP-N-acetylmuramoyl-tripeptide--D-alanyl-D-alanine ligase